MNALIQHSVLAAGSADTWSTALRLGVVALPFLAYAWLVIGALVSIVGSAHDLGMKLVWVVFVFIAPFIGSLLWFFVGRSHARRAVTGTYAGTR